MRIFKGVVLVLFMSIFHSNDLSALTPEQCHQMEGECFCIAFPGSKPTCALSRTQVLSDKKSAKEQWDFFVKAQEERKNLLQG